MGRRRDAETQLQSGHRGPELGEAGGLEPRVVVRDDVWVAEGLEEADLAQDLEEVRARLADRDLLDRKVACGDERRGD